MKLLYRTAEWHALAKLRMHTDTSLSLLEELTTEFGDLLRKFRDLTCSKFSTVELPRETAARNRREMLNQQAAGSSSATANQREQPTAPNPDPHRPESNVQVNDTETGRLSASNTRT